MATRTYIVGTNSRVRRLDELTGPWTEVAVNLAPLGVPISVILRDVMTDPLNSDKVFVVGQRDVGTGATGIYISSDAGAVWSQPSGDIALLGLDFGNLWEVWAVSSTVIYACGDGGLVFKSTDGGATFNQTTTLPTPTGLIDTKVNAYSIHFIDANTGIVGVNDFVYKTTNGGATWTALNGGVAINNPSPIVSFRGVHLSADQQKIVALGERGIYYSADGGATFSFVQTFGALGLHLTWTNDNLLYGFGTGSQRVGTVDGGATWSTINAFDGTGIAHHAAHLYAEPNGFYSANGNIFATADSFTTGALSDSQQWTIFAVWTRVDEPVEPCGCPEGFTYNFETEECDGFQTTDVIASPTIYTVGTGNKLTAYSMSTNFYQNIDALPYPISSLGGVMKDSFAVPLAITNNVMNDLWGDVQMPDTINGRLNVAGIWTDIPLVGITQNPTNEWIGFTACVEVPETKVYYIGIGADNKARFKINGQLIAYLDGCTNTFNFGTWHVFPITLSAGTNFVELEGWNCNNYAAFAAEIYDATLPQLIAMTLEAQLEAVTIFTTKGKEGSQFDLGSNSGYSCPPGWLLSFCGGVYQCVQAMSLPFEPCNCYLATDCTNPAYQVLITTAEPLDLNRIYQFQGYGEVCFSIEVSRDCEPDATFITVVDSFVDCITCRGICYLLSDCAGVEPSQVVANDLAEYIGQVVKITRCPNICWFVEGVVACNGVSDIVTLEETFTTCVECNPPAVVPPLTLKHRSVKPGYDTPNCSPEVVEQINCNFAEAVFQQVSSRRYGITFCCEALRSFDEWTIKKEMIDLNMLQDPDMCVNGPNPCCPPRCVTAVIQNLCAVPENVIGRILRP